MERYPEQIYPQLKQWNTSKYSWQRRISLTSLMLYSQLRGTVPPVSKILPMIRARLNDPDAYVQKAIGWTLRECGNVYPAETKLFINKYLNQLSPSAFSYSTEKWIRSDKTPLKELRAEFRKNQKR